jgi:hypothetical protein
MRASGMGSTFSRGFFLATFFFAGQAHATWSVIMLDNEAQNIGLAGAPCIDCVAGIATHAHRHSAGPNASYDHRPNFDPEFSRQQYASMTFDAFGKPVTYTGKNTEDYHGSITGNGFSTQGSMLQGSEVLEAVAAAMDEAN